ncbi:hypothetical protein QEK78_001793 [Stenotrophomonas maltophilia]|nr:hypothetical protein [Stenotrophomonas maltophilia]
MAEVEAINGGPEIAVYRSTKCAISTRFGLKRFGFSYGDATSFASPTVAVASGAKIGATCAAPAAAVASAGTAAAAARISLLNLLDRATLEVSMISFCI